MVLYLLEVFLTISAFTDRASLDLGSFDLNANLAVFLQ